VLNTRREFRQSTKCETSRSRSLPGEDAVLLSPTVNPKITAPKIPDSVLRRRGMRPIIAQGEPLED
jgi:hypothetical protein